MRLGAAADHHASMQVVEHSRALRAYEARREAAKAELQRQEQAEAVAHQSKQSTRGPRSSGVLAWLQQRWIGQPNGAPDGVPTGMDRESQLDAVLGPPPQPPQAPQGVYLYGSVGVGKSLLMDLFYSVVQEQGSVPHRRRLHFNAAMLEVNQRLHQLDKQLGQQKLFRQEQYAQQWALQEQEADGRPGERGQDPGSQQQKEATLAKLAVRRLMRQARTPGQLSRQLATSNAVVMQQAALSLIRAAGPGGDAEGGRGEVEPGAALLCFDEVQVTGPFEAVALKGVMEALLAKGCVIVATSNRAPGALNRQGLHEDLFHHSTQRLLQACDVLHLACDQDYRRMLAARSLQVVDGRAGPYLYPTSPLTAAALDSLWRAAVAQEADQRILPRTLQVAFGRRMQVERACGKVARFTFEELCRGPRGAADYIAIAAAFHTVLVDAIPSMSLQTRDQARRFTLVDELYNARVRLVATAACAPDRLFAGTQTDEPVIDLEALQFEGAVEGSKLRRNVMLDGSVGPIAHSASAAAATQAQLGGMEEKFAFRRAVSRLYEMQCTGYGPSTVAAASRT
ncbi:hypothetical protein WJX72_000026 [[Myrmecia] bisecta]|uniref:AFG1-like ATPase n=1 Tax=[Myrmecia] bisecta TaxID=41462 RepID=A0AAW1Q7W4_9CHLO